MRKIPNNWIVTKLDDICYQITDGTHKTPKYQKNGIKFISIKNIRPFKEINWDSYKKYISLDEHRKLIKRARPEKGDILFPRIGTLGFAKRINFDDEVSIFVGLGLLKPIKKCINSKYLEYYMNTPYINMLSRKKATGTGRKTLALEETKKMPFPLCPLNEQNRIVEKIEELFSGLDKATEELQKVQEQLKVYRQSVLKAAFDGKLTEEWREKENLHLPEKIKNIDNNFLKKIYKIPNSWKWLILSDIGKVVSGGTPSTKQAEYFNGDIPWITPKDLSGYTKKYISKGKRNISKRGLDNSSAKLIPKGSIIFSSRAPIGYVAITENALCTNQGFKNLVLNEGFYSDYVYYYLKNAKRLADSYASGTTFKEISGSKFAILPIPICNIKEQNQIVQEIESRLSVCDKIEESVESGLKKIEHLRQSILKKAFEGKLVPQDPKDPPVEELLEQIKIEKEKTKKNAKKKVKA
jgi:type I restriction enzyme, S subunit